MPVTWIRKDRRVSQDSHCQLCGGCYGICSNEPRVHKPATCKACGTPQCWTNGLSRGTCSVCLVGLLDSFSGHNKKCGYKGCENEAVALAPRVGRACKDHLTRATLDTAIETAIRFREEVWERVEFEFSEFPPRKSV